MEIRPLLYFITVAEEKSINKAAVRLSISQSALSQQIFRLEEEIGSALFCRTPAGIELTSAGMALLPHAYAIIAKISQAKEIALSKNGKQDTWLDVGICGSSTLTVVSEILAPFINENKGVRLNLRSNRKDQQIKLLKKGEILIAFDRNFTADSDLICELVLQEDYAYVAMHKDHPLAKRDTIERTELAKEILIAANFEYKFYDHLESINSYRTKTATQRKIKYRVDDVIASLGLAGCGASLAVVFPSTLALGLTGW